MLRVECEQENGFQAIADATFATLKLHGEAIVEVTLTDEAFRFYDIFSHGFVTEPGDFNIFVGSSCEDIRLRGGVTL